jgi:hypothetical protein
MSVKYTSVKYTKQVKCGERCSNPPAPEPHTCPLSEEGIRGEQGDLCECCPECTGNCADEV